VKPSPHRPFAVMWSFFAASGLTVLSVLAVLGWTGYEVPLPARDDVNVPRRQSPRRLTGCSSAS
jgi:hypothetical protein